MLWETYRKMYYTYLLSASQTDLIARVAQNVLEDFPKRLPADLRTPLVKSVTQLWRALGVALTEVNGRQLPPCVSGEPENTQKLETGSDLFLHFLHMSIAQALGLGSPPSKADFGRLLCSQQLAMHFAHLDAFMADTLHIICKVRPEVMKSDKTIEWDTILSCGGWEELVNHLAEQYASKLAWQPISSRVAFLRNRLGLLTEYPDSDVTLLGEAEKIRNIVVHNGGRVSQEYIARTRRKDLVLGALVPVSVDYVDEVCRAALMLVSDLFIDVSKKYFGKGDSELTGVWRRASQPSGET